MRLSILICTLDSRKVFLDRLLANLKDDLSNHPEAEVIICQDNGQATTGSKRNQLLNMAKGDYIVFIDDDDLVVPNYISLIMNAIKTNPDVVGINLIMTIDGGKAERSFHSLRFDHWFDIPDTVLPDHKIYFRNPNHLNPVKKDIALKVGFPDITEAEDKAYSKGIYEYLKTEVWIDQPIYYYLFRSK